MVILTISGDLSIACKDLREGLMSHSLPVPFFSSFFLFEVEISSHAPTAFFRPGSSTVAQRGETNGLAFPDKLHVSSFP